MRKLFINYQNDAILSKTVESIEKLMAQFPKQFQLSDTHSSDLNESVLSIISIYLLIHFKLRKVREITPKLKKMMMMMMMMMMIMMMKMQMKMKKQMKKQMKLMWILKK